MFQLFGRRFTWVYQQFHRVTVAKPDTGQRVDTLLRPLEAVTSDQWVNKKFKEV